jgi:hypothetical protein
VTAVLSAFVEYLAGGVGSVVELLFGKQPIVVPPSAADRPVAPVEFLDGEHLQRIIEFPSPSLPPLVVAPLVPLLAAPEPEDHSEPVVVVRASCTCDATYWRNRVADLEVENDRLAAALGRLNTERALVSAAPVSWGSE